MNVRTAPLVALALALATQSPGAVAGSQGDQLSRCTIDSTSQQDRLRLMVWVFSAITRHPGLQGLSRVDEAGLDRANADMAGLATRLLTDDCRDQAREAIRAEGMDAIKNSFKLLGELAAREMFNSPEVAGAMQGFERHLDKPRFQALVE